MQVWGHTEHGAKSENSDIMKKDSSFEGGKKKKKKRIYNFSALFFFLLNQGLGGRYEGTVSRQQRCPISSTYGAEDLVLLKKIRVKKDYFFFIFFFYKTLEEVRVRESESAKNLFFKKFIF